MPHQRRRNARRKSLSWLQGKIKPFLLIALGAIALIILVLVLRPSSQLMNSAEIARAQRLGVLRVGVRTDVPGFNAGGEGLEIMLARELTAMIFPGEDPGIMLELVPVTAYTALTKLDHGDIDVTFSLQRNRGSSDYTYSEPYYMDTMYVLCRPENISTPLEGKTVALIAGTAGEIGWQRYVSRTGSAVAAHTDYAAYPDLIMALLHGKEDFVVIPGAVVDEFLTDGVVIHSQTMDAVGYVAVSRAEKPAFALLAGLMIEDVERSGLLDTWIAAYGLGAHRAAPAEDD